MNPDSPRNYAIGTPGQAWSAGEIHQWRALQQAQRSYATDVLAAIDRLPTSWEVVEYGRLDEDPSRFPLKALRSKHWRDERPSVLVTGGVHGYETSGVHGALNFAAGAALPSLDRVNLLVAPCVSPWAYETIQRWNPHAVDPNRSFKAGGAAQESTALMALLAPLRTQFAAHIDLHETTDTDESEFRPAKAARDGVAYEPDEIPDGFYLVDDTEHPEPGFQQAIIEAVSKVTHIAPPDARGQIIGSPMVAPGVIRYDLRALGLCAGLTEARYRTTTEVYPDSSRATPQQCIDAQVAAVCAAIEFILSA